MRFNKLDLNLLVAFDAIMSEGSVSKAANKLNLSQSATSSALARLRDYFEDPLFVAGRRGLLPTKLAEELALPVRSLLSDAQTRIIARKSFDPGTTAQDFTIGASDYIARVFLSSFARDLAAIAPGIRLQVRTLAAGNVRDDLAKGLLDILICPKEVTLPNLPTQEVFAEDFVVVSCAAQSDILAPLTREQFETLSHAVVLLGRERAPGIDEFVCNSNGVTRQIGVVVDSFEHIVPFIVGTSRIAMLPRGMADYHAKSYDIAIHEMPFGTNDIRIMMQWQTFSQNSPPHEWLRTKLNDHMQDIMRASSQ